MHSKSAQTYFAREERLARRRAEGHDLQPAELITAEVEPPKPVPSPPPERVRNEAGQYLFDLSLPVKRVTWADLNNQDWHSWLRSRVSEHFHITMQGAEGHLRSWSNRNDALLIRCDEVTGLAVIAGNPVTSRKAVEEVFVFVREKVPGWQKSAVRVYREFQIWTATLGLDRLEIGTASDITDGKLAGLVGAEEETRLWLVPRRQ